MNRLKQSLVLEEEDMDSEQMEESDPFIQTTRTASSDANDRKDEDNALGSIYNEVDWPVPQQRFLRKFPIILERKLQSFDDALIKVCQKAKGRVVLYFDLFMTAIVAIETGIAAPFIFFALGLDGLAIEMTYLMIILSLLSQVPKRFIWRYRPYMVQRASKLRKKESAVTSSFPSRAVTCAVVYTFFVCYAYIISKQPSNPTVLWWMPILFVLVVLLSSFARISMGVHYPSDCVFGILQGIIVCVIGTLLWSANSAICESCYDDQCYSDLNSDHVVTAHSLKRYNYISLIICIALGTLITFISVTKPIDFWEKADRVYGMLFPGIAFRITLLCPRTVHSSLPHPDPSPWYGYIFAIGIALIATAAAFLNKGRYPVLSFLIQFSVLYVAIAAWRIWVL